MSERSINSPENGTSPETLKLFKEFVEARLVELEVVTHDTEPMLREDRRREIHSGTYTIEDDTQLVPVSYIEYKHSRWFDADDKDLPDDFSWSVSIGLSDSDPYFSISATQDDIQHEVGNAEIISETAGDALVRTLLATIEAGEAAGTITYRAD